MIRFFLFDLGNVLFPFDFSKVLGFIKENTSNISKETIGRLIRILDEYEVGKISTGAFFDKVRRETGYTGTFERFKRAFSEIFTENPEAITVARRLKKKYPLYILSNTNELHLNYIKNTFSCFREISEGVYSYQVGVAKPDPRIFRIAIEQYNLEPGSTLFIDDKKGNIDSAAALGLQTLLYPSENGKIPRPLRDELTSLGIEL